MVKKTTSMTMTSFSLLLLNTRLSRLSRLSSSSSIAISRKTIDTSLNLRAEEGGEEGKKEKQQRQQEEEEVG